MKKIGIIGGIGPASTVEYYKGIVNGYRQITNDDSYPQFFINSINMTEMLRFVADEDWEKLVDFLAEKIDTLVKTGADYAALASNTPHLVIDELVKRSKVPLISILDETCKYTKSIGLKKVLLTGTLFSMKHNIYKKPLEKYGIECFVPEDNDKTVIHNIIFPDLENGIINEKDKITFKEICVKNIKEKNIDGIILGCTELPLMIKKDDFDVAVIDTMEIHINSIVEKIVKEG
ncbi:MAG: amino acid racemase [Treponema sp.]|nr:amino acid racemase [Treponema sp.]